MGSKTSLLLQEEEIIQISKETGFTPNQISRLYSRFISLDKSEAGKLCPTDLMRIPELAINPLGSRIVEAFFANCSRESDTINFRQFVKTLAIFRPQRKNEVDNDVNSRASKLKFAFSIYDLENNGTVSGEDLLVILKMMVGCNITEEQLKAIALRTMNEADQNGTGMLSFDDFEQALTRVEAEQTMSIRFLD
ncbi:putative calcium-binding protein p22 [Apostichopus japonicus]|uniref:Putative calcium-binding protein p22 n=1 Tax=Stichopus japonicus TaxID=307972 RepID=A0A2G8LL82_STIJA|nr:putative calcium-binding protein p22 [Apostichopus japonicus]